MDSKKNHLANTGSPTLLCEKLPAFNSERLEDVRQIFYRTVPCRLGQSWLPVPQKQFAPGLIYTGWRGSEFFVFAELVDNDVFTSAEQHQQPLWMLGDTFEIFLCKLGNEQYYEFHIAPNNTRLQLCFPDKLSVERVARSKRFEEVLMNGDHFISRTWVKPEIQRWFVLVQISGQLMEQPDQLLAAQWLFSFCRYDYARDEKVPVISSTSAHTKADFHRRQEWGTICFK